MEEQIFSLYKKGNSIRKVSEVLGVGRSKVYNLLKEHKLIRSMSESAKLKKLSDSHKRNISLSQKGKPKEKLRQNLKEGFNEDSLDLTYIIAVLRTDAFFWKQGIGLEVIDEEFADEFKSALERQFGLRVCEYQYKRKPLVDWRNGKEYVRKQTYLIRVNSMSLKEFLLDYKKNFNIFEKDIKHKIVYLRGIWDSEGTRSKYQVMFCNKNIDRINEFMKLCNEIGIWNVNYFKNKTEFIAYFGRKEQVKLFFEIIKPTIRRKYLK